MNPLDLLNPLMRPYLRKIFRMVGEDCTVHYPFQVTFIDGSTYSNCKSGECPEVTLVFKTPRSERAVYYSAHCGLFDQYIEGGIDFGHPSDITKFAQMGWSARAANRIWNPITVLGVALKTLWMEYAYSNKSLKQARDNAIAHYNLPGEFFRLVLGRTYGYTEGYSQEYGAPLDEAQHDRFDYAARKLRIEPGMKVAEVGSGWGYMTVHMAKKYGAKVTSHGIVPEQNKTMMQMANEEGVADKVKVVDKDHRELVNEPETYDRYVSLGVYEHAGRGCHEDWIKSISASLKPGGIGVISAMAFMRPTVTAYLTTKYIFPGGNLPSFANILLLMEKYGLTVLDVENLWHHYQIAVQQWCDNFDRHWDTIRKIDPKCFDERFRRIWNMYLRGCWVPFDEYAGGLNVFHVTFTKGRHKDFYPPTRDFLYAQKAAQPIAIPELGFTTKTRLNSQK